MAYPESNNSTDLICHLEEPGKLTPDSVGSLFSDVAGNDCCDASNSQPGERSTGVDHAELVSGDGHDQSTDVEDQR